MGKKMDARQYIKIRGANENNLKNIDCLLYTSPSPRD